MTKKPSTESYDLRDMFAIAALPALIALYDDGEGADDDELAHRAYSVADAMLAAREEHASARIDDPDAGAP